MMDERTFHRCLTTRPPGDPTYPPRLGVRPGAAPFHRPAGFASRRLVPVLALLLLLGTVAAAGGALLLRPAPTPMVDTRFQVVPTGSMQSGRAHHTATLLPDGRVLVVGGDRLRGSSGASAVPSAEVWHPGSGDFQTAGRMLHARGGHTATLLPDGRVLVIGGFGGMESRGGQIMPATAEIWDPVSEAFTPAGELSTPRLDHLAVLLPDGRVLVIGGRERVDGGFTASAEIWSPATMSFSDAGTIGVTPRARATALADGRVLVVDGQQALIWDPVSAAFGPADGIPIPAAPPFGPPVKGRAGFTATALPDGRWLITGGVGGTRRCASSPRPDGSCFASTNGQDVLRSAEIHQPVVHATDAP